MAEYPEMSGHQPPRFVARSLVGLCIGLLIISLSACGGETVSVSLGSNSSTKPSIAIGGGSSNGSGNGAGNSYGNNSGGNSGGGGATHFGVQLKTSGCHASGGLQDSACTPGAIISTATVAQICVSGYSSGVRNVPSSEKDQVYLEYGIRGHQTGEYEVDHLVSLELGGSNDISNLWPEAASPKPGFHEKDQVENWLHDQVCSNAISLADAQREIATNWLIVYQQKIQGH